MVPLETPARSAISWSLVLASPHSPKTSRAAWMICWGRSSGRLRHFGDFGGAGAVRVIRRQIVTDQSVRYTDLRPSQLVHAVQRWKRATNDTPPRVSVPDAHGAGLFLLRRGLVGGLARFL